MLLNLSTHISISKAYHMYNRLFKNMHMIKHGENVVTSWELMNSDDRLIPESLVKATVNLEKIVRNNPNLLKTRGELKKFIIEPTIVIDTRLPIFILPIECGCEEGLDLPLFIGDKYIYTINPYEQNPENAVHILCETVDMLFDEEPNEEHYNRINNNIVISEIHTELHLEYQDIDLYDYFPNNKLNSIEELGRLFNLSEDVNKLLAKMKNLEEIPEGIEHQPLIVTADEKNKVFVSMVDPNTLRTTIGLKDFEEIQNAPELFTTLLVPSKLSLTILELDYNMYYYGNGKLKVFDLHTNTLSEDLINHNKFYPFLTIARDLEVSEVLYDDSEEVVGGENFSKTMKNIKYKTGRLLGKAVKLPVDIYRLVEEMIDHFHEWHKDVKQTEEIKERERVFNDNFSNTWDSIRNWIWGAVAAGGALLFGVNIVIAIIIGLLMKAYKNMRNDEMRMRAVRILETEIEICDKKIAWSESEGDYKATAKLMRYKSILSTQLAKATRSNLLKKMI